ncbi:Vacuolar protein sorting-associated protein 13D [Tyrophagus putrescentiae]|nr:Vacuolar protein sorting-associated protein 13D [Tyrophagus putrescentiae]
MLESFAAWLLNTYIGDYFGNVNTDQLRMSLHSGEIELERLPLKRDLIKHLGLPLEASTGYIGKISIKFPRWHLFTSEPLVITIDELYLLVKPITNFTYNEEEENRAQQEFKMSQLDMLEQRWKALHEEESQNSSYYSSSYSSWLRVANYGSSFFTNILLNVHLKVSSIHLRYEDQATIPGCPFATGVLIRSLSVCSTDEHWTPKYVTREALADQHHNLLFKAIELESFAVYFDTDTGLYQNPKDKTSSAQPPPLSSLVEHMRANVERNRSPTGALFDHNYIIAPVNGRAHLKRNSSELSLKSCRSPRTVIDVQLEQVPIMMTAVQYKHLLDWSLAFQTSKTLWRYRKWRPMISRRSNRRRRQQRLKSRSSRSRTVSIEEGLNLEAEELEEEEEEEFEEEEEDEEEHQQNRSSSCRPRLRRPHLYRQRRQRFNWAFILRRARDVVAYHAAYLHYLITPELYGKEMRAVKERVEAELSLDEICSIREVVFAESDRLLREQQQQQLQASGSWFFPYSLLSNMYYSYGTSSSSSSAAQPSAQSTEVSPTTEQEQSKAEEAKEEAKKKKKHRRNLSTSSTGSFGTTPGGTDDIFLLRDAVFCQFNFQIRNSSFQLIAFNSLDGGEGTSSSSTSANNSSSSGNLLLEFEFNKMAIGVDITNPNAYACVCHMNQGWRRRAQQPQQQSYQQQDPKQTTSPSKAFLTQNELNMLQFNLAFECRHLELTLLRTEGAPIISGAGSAEASRLATAQLTGCGLVFVFSSHFVSIDGRLDSLEILDLVGAGSENRHRRVLSIEVVAAATSGEDRSFRGGGSGFQNTSSSSELEKAFSFGLSRTFTENVLRLNILMASFVYVHSPVLVAEISRCRECFSDVLEAYFSRSFKERVKAATTEMLRGIVKTTTASASSPSADNSTSGDTSKGDGSFKTELGPRTAQKLSLGTKGVRGGGGPVRQKPKSQQISPFIDNFKLNIFISSPVIIFPISPASYEVVVCHLGHMLLNNHSHSSELIMSSSSSKKSSRSQVMMNGGGLKYSTFSSPNISSSSANSASGNSTSTSTNSDSYNAEIRDLSVYSLDCARNIAAFEELSLQQGGGGGGKTPKEKGVRGLCSEAMPMAELYACEPFGVPILSKTVVEIVLEKKVLMSSLMTEGTGTGAYGRPLSSRLSTSPQPPQQKRSSSEVRSLPVVPKTSTSSTASGGSGGGAISAGKKDEPKKDDEEEEDSALNMEELEELFRGELQRQRRKSSAAKAAAAAEEGKMKRKPSTTEDQPPKLSDLDPAQFKLALDKLQDLGFEYGESLRALALTAGDVIEAAFMLSSSGGDRKNEKEGEKEAGNSDGDAHSQCTTRSADLSASNTEKSASYQNLLLMAGGGGNSAAQAGDAMSNSTTTTTTMSQGGTASRGASAGSSRKKAENSSSGSSLLSSLSVIELRVASGTIRIIDDCNQLDIPLVELGVREARLLQQNGSPVIEATAQLGAAYCDLYNSHLGGWEPVVEEGARVAASWKIHHQRAQLKSMVASSGRGSGAGQGGHQGYKAARRKLALKVEVKRMVNLNVSRTMLDMVEKVQRTWVADIAAWMALPPGAANETGSDVQLLLPSGGSSGTVRFSAGKGPDLVTHCDLRESIEASAGQVVCFDIVDTREQLSAHSGHQSRWSRAETSKSSSSSSKRLQTQKITVKVDGWSATPFPLSIEREGTFVRHIVSELYFKQSAVLVFDIALQPTTAVKLITVRSSLQVLNKTTKNVELSFANTAALGPKDERRMQTRYIIAPGGVLPVPLKLLYARMQLRPCDLGLGACRTPDQLEPCAAICTPITHSSAASYSASAPYVVTVLVERNSIGALVESRKASSVQNGGNLANGINATNSSSASMNSLANGNFEGSAVSNVYGHTPLVTIPSHTITLLPPLQLANRLPYELKFVISSSSGSNSSSSGSGSGSFSHHHHSSPPLLQTLRRRRRAASSSRARTTRSTTSAPWSRSPWSSVWSTFPARSPLLITPGATKDYTAAVDMYDANGRLLVLQAAVTVVAGRGGPSGGALGALGGALGGGGSQPCNAMTITLYSPYWIVNRSGLPLIFAQEGVYVEAAGQGEEHERARALSPLLYSHAEAEAPKFAVMRLGRMTAAVEPRWCNYFLLEKGTFYRRLRVTECTGPVGGRSGSINSFDPLTASPGRAHAHYFPPATEKIYEFGIDIRSGRDRYSNTKIVTIAPRYQIENLTTYRLEFAQKCMVDGSGSSNSSTGYHSNQSSFSGGEYGGSPIGHRGSFAAHRSSFGGGGYLQQQQQQIISMSSATSAISALPKSNTPFHWPATDSPKLLVVRISSLPGCAWSGAFTVGAEPSASFHLNIRDDSGRSFFLRVEILLQSATYFIVFTEANQLPPPVRVENFSQVPIEFYQAGTTSLLQRTRVRPNSSIPYALDEPLLPGHLTVAAPGGACSTYDLNSFAPGDSLTYDNFYYIAFEETFAQATAFGFGGGGGGFYGTGYLAHDLDDDEQLMLMMLAGGGGGGGGGDLMDDDLSLGPGAQMLVLDVPDGTEYLSFQGGEHFGSSSPPTAEMKPVLLTRKERGKRSQLWRIDVHSRIIHEGSCPPVEPGSAGLRENFSSTADLGLCGRQVWRRK